MISLTLPWAPSTNHSHHYGSGRKFMSKQTRQFREKVQEIVIEKHAKIKGDVRLAIFYAFYPPDKRRRDIGNYEKQTTDALMEAGVFEDDEQIDFIWLVRRPQVKGGQVKVVIVEHTQVGQMLENYQEYI
jgi:Holliday junction resolvase RusA-like endonuclease